MSPPARARSSTLRRRPIASASTGFWIVDRLLVLQHGQAAEQRPDPGGGAQAEPPIERPQVGTVLFPEVHCGPVRMRGVANDADHEPSHEAHGEDEAGD